MAKVLDPKIYGAYKKALETGTIKQDQYDSYINRFGSAEQKSTVADTKITTPTTKSAQEISREKFLSTASDEQIKSDIASAGSVGVNLPSSQAELDRRANTSKISANEKKTALGSTETVIKTPYDPTSQGVNVKNEVRSTSTALEGGTATGFQNPPQIDLSQGILAQIRNQTSANKEVLKAQIKSNLETALAGVTEEGIRATEQFQTARNVADVSSIQGTSRLQEVLANLGQSGGEAGTAVRRNIQAGASTQADITSQENIASLERNRRTENLKNLSASQLIEQMANLDAQEASQLIAQLNADRSFGVQEAQLTGIYDGKETLAGASQRMSNEIAQINLDAYPEQIKLEMEQLGQSIENGKLTVEQAQIQLDELTNPDSVTNQLKDLELKYNKAVTEGLIEQNSQASKEFEAKYNQLLSLDPIERAKAQAELDILRQGLNDNQSNQEAKTVFIERLREGKEEAQFFFINNEAMFERLGIRDWALEQLQ